MEGDCKLHSDGIGDEEDLALTCRLSPRRSRSTLMITALASSAMPRTPCRLPFVFPFARINRQRAEQHWAGQKRSEMPRFYRAELHFGNREARTSA
jgi:hypothetical protein